MKLLKDRADLDKYFPKEWKESFQEGFLEDFKEAFQEEIQKDWKDKPWKIDREIASNLIKKGFCSKIILESTGLAKKNQKN